MPRPGWPDWGVYVDRDCFCEYCGFDGTGYLAWQQLEIDHIIPQSKGGRDAPLNKAVACHGCNRDKGFYDPRSGEAVTEPSGPAMRAEMIQRAWQHIKECRLQKQYPSAHEDMAKDIQAKKRK
jgi:hypothetical protein